jgi:hypothetical protein
MRKSFMIVVGLLAVSLLQAQDPDTQRLPAFLGAEGFGAYARGGRGGDVYIVSNLKNAGKGSFRHGLNSATGPRTIVFGVSGIIKLKSPLVISKNYITVAGQTAPGDGICLRDAPLIVNADHVIVRYMRSRLGDEAGVEADAISIASGHHVMIDHCSASWSVDEVLSCSTGRKGEIDSITVQWCIISEALHNSVHQKGPHGYGALVRGCYGACYTYHHNLFAHNYTRNPRPGNYDYNDHLKDPDGLRFDFRNNVVYNWDGRWPGYDADTNSVCHYNYAGNYVVPGSNSGLPGWAYHAGSKFFRAYYEDNYFNGQRPDDPWSLVHFDSTWTPGAIQTYKQDGPYPTGPITTHQANEAYNLVLSQAGASRSRDATDTRIANDVRNGTGRIIDSQAQVGGWDDYRGGSVAKDTDRDGIPDQWENAMGLDPEDPEDRNSDPDGNGYTYLEIYINSLIDK